MGSASREALAKVVKLLDGPVAEAAGSELLSAAEELRSNQQLSAALIDNAASVADKATLVSRVFGGFSGSARSVLIEATGERWSNAAEFAAGIEELGIRAVAATDRDLSDELIAVANVVDSSHDLELNLGSKLADPTAKTAAAKQLFGNKVSAGALTVVTHLVSNPAGGRLSPALREAARVAADQTGATLATVTAAAPLDAERLERLGRALTRIAGRQVKISTIIDPTLVGGLRVQIADEIIDGSVSARLDDLRLQLAG
ncbi:ATP synthase F1 subunit delta [Canibacter zhoujuaniae]|uniref:ATP synthase F1 subunit delta n=1 Tax=Canibacter zhoujuaniae TaxID=2708343 RepID=UPI0014228DBB|nr:ATP synthase F1 subunit delta [Canibacter zhoujuaniae]